MSDAIIIRDLPETWVNSVSLLGFKLRRLQLWWFTNSRSQIGLLEETEKECIYVDIILLYSKLFPWYLSHGTIKEQEPGFCYIKGKHYVFRFHHCIYCSSSSLKPSLWIGQSHVLFYACLVSPASLPVQVLCSDIDFRILYTHPLLHPHMWRA